jgi:serine O-acetyltransferase
VEGRRPEGPDADWVHLPDPIADAIKALSTRIAALEKSTAGAPRDGPRREAEGREGRSVGPNPAGG